MPTPELLGVHFAQAFVALAGDDEMQAGKITLKNMTTGEQTLLTPQQLIESIT